MHMFKEKGCGRILNAQLLSYGLFQRMLRAYLIISQIKTEALIAIDENYIRFQNDFFTYSKVQKFQFFNDTYAYNYCPAFYHALFNIVLAILI